MTYTNFMEEQRREYADLYNRYSIIRDNLPARKDYQTKADYISAYYTAAVNMLNTFGYAGFIKRISMITEFTPIDYAYMRLFNRINNIPEMKEYVFFPDKGVMAEAEIKYRIVGFKLAMSKIRNKIGNVYFRYSDTIQKRSVYIALGEFTPSENVATGLRIVPNPKDYKLKTREELLEDPEYFELREEDK